MSTSAEPQLITTSTGASFDAVVHPVGISPQELVRQFAAAGSNVSSDVVCAIEFTHFSPHQRDALLPLLWQYILDHRDSNVCSDLIGAAAAIRKYVAIMPMDQMGQLAVLLEAGHRSPLAIDLEIEIAKMVYRNFEAHPPVVADPQPELAQRLWEMAQAYVNPRILLRDKCSAVASLAIEAIVAMRSPLAELAWRAASECPYRWFAELVDDEIEELRHKWEDTNSDAAAWLRALQDCVPAQA